MLLLPCEILVDNMTLMYFPSCLKFFIVTTIPPYPIFIHLSTGRRTMGLLEGAVTRAVLRKHKNEKNGRFMPCCLGRALYSVQISLWQVQRVVLHCDVAGIEETAVRRIRKSNYRTWHQTLRLRASAACLTTLSYFFSLFLNIIKNGKPLATLRQ